mmetsp:Transcript_30344/g.87526  ORF Transcript_30344/g.87526 Transcript_30344/m.87526 type:complete len:227 (-) Transcript_30344:3801-4481(-)
MKARLPTRGEETCAETVRTGEATVRRTGTNPLPPPPPGPGMRAALPGELGIAMRNELDRVGELPCRDGDGALPCRIGVIADPLCRLGDKGPLPCREGEDAPLAGLGRKDPMLSRGDGERAVRTCTTSSAQSEDLSDTIDVDVSPTSSAERDLTKNFTEMPEDIRVKCPSRSSRWSLRARNNTRGDGLVSRSTTSATRGSWCVEELRRPLYVSSKSCCRLPSLRSGK